MSLASWLRGDSAQTIASGTKRKQEECSDSKTPKRQFRKNHSQSSYDWYEKDENGLWHCTLCRTSKFDNPYARGHETPAKTTNHDRHASSQKHIDAVTRSSLKSQKPLQKIIANKLHKDDDLGINLLKAAYHIGKRELPKEEFMHHLEYANAVGADYSVLLSESARFTYCSNKSVTELQSAISEVILEDRITNIQRSGVFSLVLDESTDNANKKRVLMYAQSVDEDGLKYSFLSNKQIKTGSACVENIVALVLDELKQKNLDISKMVGISTDGASVMTGKKGGVVAMLRQHSPALVGVHCVAHRIALATSHAARDIPELNCYFRTISNVFRYFHNSALRSNRLREIQQILNLPELKFAELHYVRWLSMEGAVGAMYRSYPALAMCLEREAVLDATAKGLFSEVSQYKFIATTHMLMDVLPFIGRLSKNFPHDSLDFSKVQPLVDSTCASLKDLCDVHGELITKWDEFTVNCDGDTMYSRPVSESSSEAVRLRIQNNYKFEGFEDSEEEEEDEVEDCSFKPILKYYQQQKDSVTKTFNKYIEMVVENIQDRFQDSQVLNAMNALVPKNISGLKSVAMFGNDDVKILVKQFKKHLLSSTECLNEYRQYKNLVSGSYKTETLEAITRTIITKYHDEFPNMTILLKCCTVIPMNSVKCERGFSTQNRIMTRLQTRMNNKTLDDLMRISEEGPSMSEFDFPRALTKWKDEKVRKLYK